MTTPPGCPPSWLRPGGLAGPARAHPRRWARRAPRWGAQPGRRRRARGGSRRPPAVPRGGPRDARAGRDGRQGRGRDHRGPRSRTVPRDCPRPRDRGRRAPRTSRGRARRRWRALLPDGAVEAIATPEAALERALGGAAPAGPPGPIVVAGSLYLVGEVRARLVDDPALRDRRMMADRRDRARLPATRIGPAEFRWGTRTFVMGIVNATPDSFSGDGLLAGAASPIRRRGRRARAPHGRRRRRPARCRRRVDPARARHGRRGRGTASRGARGRGPACGPARHSDQHRHDEARGRGGGPRCRRRPAERRVGRRCR